MTPDPEVSWVRALKKVDWKLTPTQRTQLCDAIISTVDELLVKCHELLNDRNFVDAHALTLELVDLARMTEVLCPGVLAKR